jgi:hypothetical protein
MEIITDISLWELVKYLKQWLVNLGRASSERKAQSIRALRSVIVAARHTRAYVRQLSDTGNQSHETEGQLSVKWTELGFELHDLGLRKLAKRCEVKGRYWADPKQFDESYLKKADIGLERMERLAKQMVAEIES